MKTLFLTPFFLLSFFSFGQKIIIHVFERQELISYTKTSIDFVISYPDITYEIDTSYRKYIIDLSDETSSYFIDGENVNILPIKSTNLGDGYLKVNILENGFDYGLMINTNYDNESVTWFWFDTFTTTVKIFKKFVIEKPS